jgi:hypothetical protein
MIVLGLGVLALAIALFFGLNDRLWGGPTDLSPDVWDQNPTKRERNLVLARRAWRAGKRMQVRTKGMAPPKPTVPKRRSRS